MAGNHLNFGNLNLGNWNSPDNAHNHNNIDSGKNATGAAGLDTRPDAGAAAIPDPDSEFDMQIDGQMDVENLPTLGDRRNGVLQRLKVLMNSMIQGDYFKVPEKHLKLVRTTSSNFNRDGTGRRFVVRKYIEKDQSVVFKCIRTKDETKDEAKAKRGQQKS